MFIRLIYILFLFFIQSTLSSQVLQDDFEGNGNITTWFGDDCIISTDFKNPYNQVDNTSPTVLKYNDIGGLYANLRFDTKDNFDLSKSHSFSFKIYVPSSALTGNQTNQVSLKLQNATLGSPWATQSEIIKPISLDQWQTVSFDFGSDTYINLDPTSAPPIERTDFNRVLIQVNGENNNDLVVAYIDDFSYEGDLFIEPIFDDLVWSDEFNGNGTIDTSKWFHQTELPSGGSWFNGEIQHYTDRLANTSVSNGTLKIVAKKETFTDQGHTKQYTSARLNSKYTFKYGRLEIKAKMPTGIGTWPAIWMLGKNIDEDGAYWDNKGFGSAPWPECGEIDVMEHWGDNQNYISSATHTPSSFGNTVNVGGQIIPTVSTDFHVYALEWSAKKLVFSVDSVVHFTYDPATKNADTWPFDKEQYVLLNIAIQPSIANSFIESSMEVDYIRLYQESSVSIAEVKSDNYLNYYPNPVSDRLIISFDQFIDHAIDLKIYTVTGKLVKNYSKLLINNQVELENLGSLTKGVYFVICTQAGKSNSFKFLKQ